MNMASAWTFFLLVATVGSNPLMKYSFCPLSEPRCQPTYFASHSPFEFGNITSGVYYYESGEPKPLVVSCTFHEPLHWTLTLHETVRVSSILSSVTTNGSHLLYYYHIQVNEAQSGLIRCESYSDSNLAAEIFIAERKRAYDYTRMKHWVHHFISTSPRRGGQMIVPCSMRAFDPSIDASKIRLKKLRQNDMLVSNVSLACFNCFPHDERNEVNCATSCPYNISKQLWNDAWRPIGANKTATKWLQCIQDSKCAFETVTKMPEFENTDCNEDLETTCSDYISAITSYPDSCVKGSSSYAKFVDIEACVVKNLAQSLESTEADYDPRVGFRLKTERDMDAVYICSSRTSALYMSTYCPTQKIKAELQATDNNTNGPLKGIYCTVPAKWMENLDMDLVPCSTLFDCELQLQVYEGQAYMRTSTTVVSGETISTRYPLEYGRIIQNPPTSGVLSCVGIYRLKVGYIFDLQYFFTGLDSKLCKCSIATIKYQLSVEQHTSRGGHNFKESANRLDHVQQNYGRKRWIRKTERMSGEEDSRSASRSLEVSAGEGASVVSIRCRAPYRNSRNEAQAVLLIETVAVEPDTKEQLMDSTEQAEDIITIEPPEMTALPEVDSSSSSQVYLVVVLAMASGVILLAAVTCAIYAVRKYKRSKELRQLNLEEIHEFWNGNAALATGSHREVNIDGIGFPECFQIPALDLKIHTEEVLGEGEFGRCVSGHYHDQKVAVKTTKDSMGVDTFKDFLREVKIMAYLGKHENIIEFLGAVVNQLRDRICLAVVELSPYGNLLSYLRQNDAENPSNISLYANMSRGEPLGGSEGTKLGLKHLSYFCEQIAAGMEFLVEKRVIHGDLAARNVLVFPDYVVKITDFGLSRKLYTASNYKKKSATPLPWRWMALESLKYMEFSPMTDMWGYGVTAWEIFTLGQVPYSGLVYSHEFFAELEQGRRLQRPKNASEEIYQFMKLTWDRIPSARPSFRDARIFFRRLSARSH